MRTPVGRGEASGQCKRIKESPPLTRSGELGVYRRPKIGIREQGRLTAIPQISWLEQHSSAQAILRDFSSRHQ
jgi:hypothetical protein